MATVPYVNLGAQHTPIEAEILEAVQKVLRSGWFILGPEVQALEAKLAEYLDVPAVVGLNSGTDALLMALRLRDIGPGDEVITVSHSFVATASAIRLVGATPVFVDIDPQSMLMDPQKLEGALTAKTKAVIPVHLGGFTCDMGAISAFCEAHGLALIEDAAQSIGSTHRGRAGGSFGLGCFSLHPLKILSACGDAGFLCLQNEADAHQIRQFRNLGLENRNNCAYVSGNSRLDTLQAAILLVKMRYLDDWIDQRIAHANAYRAAFEGLLPMSPLPAGDRAVYSTFVIRHPQRDEFVKRLQARGVDAKIHYPLAIHQQSAFADMPRPHLPVTERIVNEIISLPVTPEVDIAGREQVIDAVLKTTEELGRVRLS